MSSERTSAMSAVRWLLARYARPSLSVIGLMTTATLVGNVLTVVQPAILAGLLANLADSEPAAVPADASALNLNYLGARITTFAATRLGVADSLVVFGVLFVAVSVASAALTYASEALASRLKVRITHLIQVDLLRHLLSQDMTFFSRQKTGELMSRVTLDASATANALGPLVRSLLQPAVQLTIYSVYLFSTSITLTIGAIVLLVAQLGVTQALRRPMRRLVRLESDMAADLSAALQEAFTSIRVTKSFGAEAFELAKLSATIDRVGRGLLRKAHLEKLENPLRSILDSLATLGIFLIAIVLMRRGELTFQGLLLFTYVGRLLITPINSMATNVLWIEQLGASFQRISEMLADQPRIVDGPLAKATLEHSVDLENVTFSYGPRPAVEQVSLSIRRGEFVALVGPSGAGKSTLGDLLLRLYDPQEGRVTIDGLDLRTIRQAEYRRMFGVVSQESLLFHDSVKNNIRFGRRDLTDADIVRAAQIANADAFIRALPQGYDTVVGDRGTMLSGGERQRIAIARAVVHKPQVLILDEATSALDSESERLVQQAIDQVVAETTAIVIAHRLSTVTHADRIVVLNRGRIETIGTHARLLETSPLYQSFCALQFQAPNPQETVGESS
jgi:subfamily B ATP-binding cassette protein MsbA